MTAWITWVTTITVLLLSVILYPVAVRVRRRSKTSRPDGIQVISDPDNPAFDIVAVHGLGAHPEYTWSYDVPAKSVDASGARRIHLLKDLLKSDFPSARILSFAYNSDWLIDAPVKTALQIANKLLEDLVDDRRNRPCVPIIFVGHSFGGIIIKEVLSRSEDRSQEILNNTCGIIFLGTPHLGSRVSLSGAVVAFLTGFLGSNNTLLLSLRSGHRQLSDLETEFIYHMDQKEIRAGKTQIVSFHETKPTYIFGWFSIGIVVDIDSARGHATKAIPIDTDHSSLNKCQRGDALYNELVKELDRLKPTDKPKLNGNQKFVIDKLSTVRDAAFDSQGNEHATCLDGTRTVLLEEIDQWAHNSECKHIFWLQGMAGTGKSTISRTVAHRLAANGYLGASFFFKRGEGDRGKASLFFATVAAQLVCKLPRMAGHVRNALEAEPDIAEKSIRDQFKKLILDPLKEISGGIQRPSRTIVVVVDALDECDRDDHVSTIITLLPQMKQLPSVSLKFFITSRPDSPIIRGFADISGNYQDLVLHQIDERLIKSDIELFLESELSNIRERYNKELNNPQLTRDWPGQSNLTTLVEMTVPLFIFAKTVCLFVGDEGWGWDPQQQLSRVLENRAMGREFQLHATYLPVLRQMITKRTDCGYVNRSDEEKAIILKEFNDIVGSIVLLADPLSVKSLAQLLPYSEPQIWVRIKMLRSVLNIPSGTDYPVRILHLSFREFLTDPCNRDINEFWIDERHIHKNLAQYCVHLLSCSLQKDPCQLLDPTTLRSEISQTNIDKALSPAVQYACRYWVAHIQKGHIELQDYDPTHKFLQDHFLHWLEAMSLMGKVADAILALTDLGRAVTSNKSPVLHDFIHDCQRFVLAFRHALAIAPGQIYKSALLFSPKDSIIRKTYLPRYRIPMRYYPLTQERWDACLQTFEGHTKTVMSVAFSPDRQLVASGSADDTVRVWDILTGETHTIFDGHSAWITSVAFSPDGQLIASGSHDCTVQLWDTSAGKTYAIFNGHKGWVMSIAFSPDRHLVASGSADHTVQLWDISTHKNYMIFNGHGGYVTSVAFSPDGQLVASGSADHTVRLWDTLSGETRAIFDSHRDRVTSVAFSPDGQLVALGSANRTVRLWDTSTGETRTVFNNHRKWVSGIAFSPNGRSIASGSYDHTVQLSDISTGETRAIFNGHADWVRSVAFSPDGQLVASGSDDHTVRLWDTLSGETRATFNGHRNKVRSIAFSPDGQLVASGSDDCTVQLWNTLTGKAYMVFRGHDDKVTSVTFSPNGQIVASASDDHTVRLWNTLTGETHMTFNGHAEIVTAFSPDGLLMVSGSGDYTVQVWDILTGKTRAIFDSHDAWITSVAFSPDGQTVVSASGDRTVRLWDVQQAKHKLTISLSSIPEKLEFRSDPNTIFINGEAFSTHSGRPEIGDTDQMHDSAVNDRVYTVGEWLMKGSRRVLWLPPEHRPVVEASQGDILVSGFTDGRVTFLYLQDEPGSETG